MNQTLKLPVGIENFEDIRKLGFYYIDKTKLIEQLLQNWGKVNLFTRPRRFGKTLNMSMLRTFFEIGMDKSLFEGLYISKNKELCDEYMGKYPVIFLSLKGIDGLTFEEAIIRITTIIKNEARRHHYLKNSDKLIEEEIKYIGSQLAPHWIYKNFGIQGDAIVAFKGECEVKLTEMVDIEDVINNEPIYSKYMLSFITEQFGVNLVEGVFRQRLLICIIKELLEENSIFVVRNGDDLMIDGRKLSVSIATKSITSVLIHTGLNIVSEGAPVKASGLTSELGIQNIDAFALEVMKRYSEEIDDIKMASTKVRGV